MNLVYFSVRFSLNVKLLIQLNCSIKGLEEEIIKFIYPVSQHCFMTHNTVFEDIFPSMFNTKTHQSRSTHSPFSLFPNLNCCLILTLVCRSILDHD